MKWQKNAARRFPDAVLFILATVVAAHSARATESVIQTERPNIVYLLVDDLGWADLGCYGSDLHETPNIDRLARESVRFTDAYAAAPVCTPTRAAIMTGEHPARLHMTIWREAARNPPKNSKVIPPVTEEDLPLKKVTIAERLQAAGYVTAHIGKWHLGDAAHYPETQGFDLGVGGTHWGCPATFFYPYRGMLHGDYRYVPGLGLGEVGDYLTDRLTDEAIEVVDAARDRPFFLYLAYYTVHVPVEGKQRLVQHYQKKVQPGMRQTNAAYAAMVHSLDENVGRILDCLEDYGIADRTILVFTSDNGGFIGDWKEQPVVTNNAPLRSGKGSLYEGGVRVPLLVHWPGTTPSNAVCSEPVVLTDTYRTIVEMAGLQTDNQDSTIGQDGVSLVPLLKNPAASLNRKALYWHYPHYYETTTPVSSIRSGNWKLLQYLDDDRVELYNLPDDPGETTNVAQQLPARREQLLRMLRVWRESVGAQMPMPNPAFGNKSPP